MATFDELSSKIEQVVFKCLSDSQEDIEDNIRKLLTPLVNNKETLELRKLTLEHVIKKIAMKYSTLQPNELIPNAFKLLDLVLRCHEVDKELCEPTLTLTILEELLETQPMEVCETLYQFLETNKQRLLVDLKPTQGKGLVLLRLSNELIRRASKSNHNAFRGRVLIFLSNSYALGERSGVNVRGECNVENVTSYNALQQGEKAEFYITFWNLQTYFNNPPRIFDGNNLNIVLEKMGVVLSQFSEILANEKEKAVIENKGNFMEIDGEDDISISLNGNNNNITSTKRKHHETEDGLEETLSLAKDYVKYFPKYLTSYALFDKEISDPNFRRIVLFQFLIILQYFTGFYPEERARIEETRAKYNNANAVQLPNFTITEQQQKIIQETWNKIIELSTLEGSKFTDTLLHILNMERRWNHWKFGQNCESVAKKFVEKLSDDDRQQKPLSKFVLAREKRMKLCKNLEPMKWKMGTPHLTKLWTNTMKVSDDKILSDSTRKRTAPTFQEVYQRIKNDGYPPENGMTFDENDYDEFSKEEKEKGWVQKWFALRAARDNYLLHFNKPAKKDAKELKDPKVANALKEAEDSKDEIAVLNILITENPTCSSGTSSKKQPLADPDSTEQKHGDHKNGVDQKNSEYKNGEHKNGDNNNPSVEQKNGEQNRVEQKNGEQNNEDTKNDDNK
ncbi:THO complex subunit 1 transcription elongation factor-domain-containing protein [Glomus cerebriforme]|uniref:THO complex subunit 1 transcription elongation factor-domain-containing protein n=1 Tax=Glomus cerebriforme TaxID=658196 RepID=A0A397S4P4_9GLOM|nr:THO complex subunit 1 transcription elongation factor-domain-containing protein [Glomus cerebriforme]